MSDVFTAKKRSAIMAAIRAKNTKPEVIVRRMLHLMGYRFRLHVSDLPGKPDVVIPKAKTIVQVKGCFWHGHRCLRGRIPVANRAYWMPKILGNRARDKRNERRLRAMGWRVKTIWECGIRHSSPEELHQRLHQFLDLQRPADLPRVQLSKLEAALMAIRHRGGPSKRPPAKKAKSSGSR